MRPSGQRVGAVNTRQKAVMYRLEARRIRLAQGGPKALDVQAMPKNSLYGRTGAW